MNKVKKVIPSIHTFGFVLHCLIGNCTVWENSKEGGKELYYPMCSVVLYYFSIEYFK